MAFFSFENKNVFYKVKGSGEPLLLIHGNSVSSRMFSTVLNMYAQKFFVITFDFPGHGKSSRLKKFETDFWYYNCEVAAALLVELQIDKVIVVGASGGALVGINLAIEYPEKVKYLVADSFEGAYPLASYIRTIEADRNRDKKKWLAKLYWWYFHGRDWKRVVDLDTAVNIEFAKSGNSFFHRSISELKVPTLLTASRKDEYCSQLDKIYAQLQQENTALKVHLFDEGKHPAMISNRQEFFKLVYSIYSLSNNSI